MGAPTPLRYEIRLTSLLTIDRRHRWSITLLSSVSGPLSRCTLSTRVCRIADTFIMAARTQREDRRSFMRRAPLTNELSKEQPSPSSPASAFGMGYAAALLLLEQRIVTVANPIASWSHCAKRFRYARVSHSSLPVCVPAPKKKMLSGPEPSVMSREGSHVFVVSSGLFKRRTRHRHEVRVMKQFRFTTPLSLFVLFPDSPCLGFQQW
jgi:hypothetical protein